MKQSKRCLMKRWDRLVDLYMEEYTAAGRAEETIKGVAARTGSLGHMAEEPTPPSRTGRSRCRFGSGVLEGAGRFSFEGDGLCGDEQVARHGRVSGARERLAEQSAPLDAWTEDRFSLWKLELLDFLRWVERERDAGRGGNSLNKNLSHLRGFLDYAWRSGRADRNVLDRFHLKDDGTVGNRNHSASRERHSW